MKCVIVMIALAAACMNAPVLADMTDMKDMPESPAKTERVS